MYQCILVPIDNSGSALAAFRHALALAKATGSALHLVHVEDISRAQVAASILPGLDRPSYEEQHQLNVTHSHGLLDHLQHESKQQAVTCSTALIEKWGGNPAQTLLNAATEVKADLIVMGTHGFSGFMRLIFGSVAESLLHHSKIPVLLIRQADDDDD